MSTLASFNLKLCPRSPVTLDGAEYALAQTTAGVRLAMLADPDSKSLLSA